MHSKQNGVLMLADSRCRELQDEAARLRLAREGIRCRSHVALTISMACRQLRVTIGRALQQLGPTRWTILVPIHGAFPR